MSNAEEVEAGKNNVCANCGVAEVDDIKLEDCDGCDLVKYCSDNCKENHREQHEEECKTRAAILHDRKLFTQPDISHRGECPLCFLPLPLDPRKSAFYPCCSKVVCYGCVFANYKSNGGDRCPFCRELVVAEDDKKKGMMKRIKANDPAALCEMGTKLFHEGEYESALHYWTKAAELRDYVDAHYQLGNMYWRGDGVEKNEEKEVYHMEKAAIGGHPDARYNLGYKERENGNNERAAKHYIIAANLGDEKSMKMLWKYYSAGAITKEDLESTLRTHQAALDEMKSPEREVAEAWREAQRDARRRN